MGIKWAPGKDHETWETELTLISYGKIQTTLTATDGSGIVAVVLHNSGLTFAEACRRGSALGAATKMLATLKEARGLLADGHKAGRAFLPALDDVIRAAEGKS